jgi:hypothetical protein
VLQLMTEHDQRCESTARGGEERFRFLRLEAGLAQPQLGDGHGITQLRRGLHRTSPKAVNRVAIELGCETAIQIERKGTA